MHLFLASPNNSRRGSALALNSLLTKGKISVKDLALKLGKSQSYISSRRALLQLPERVRQLFEAKDVPIGYAASLMKLDGMDEAQSILLGKIIEGMKGRYYGGITTIEEADEFVTRIKKQIKDKEELLAKYGPCPKCGSKNISTGYRPGQLSCQEEGCSHEWHGETKEPWAYYEMKQQAEEMGYKVEEGPETVKFTPKEVADMIVKKGEEERREKEAKGEVLPEKFRCKPTLLMLLEPMIAGDNIQKLEVRDEKIEIQLIEGMDLHFNGLRKDYKDGINKARIETAGWGGTDSVKRNHDYINKLEHS